MGDKGGGITSAMVVGLRRRAQRPIRRAIHMHGAEVEARTRLGFGADGRRQCTARPPGARRSAGGPRGALAGLAPGRVASGQDAARRACPKASQGPVGQRRQRVSVRRPGGISAAWSPSSGREGRGGQSAVRGAFSRVFTRRPFMPAKNVRRIQVAGVPFSRRGAPFERGLAPDEHAGDDGDAPEVGHRLPDVRANIFMRFLYELYERRI